MHNLTTLYHSIKVVQSLHAAEELLKILLTYHMEGVLLPDAPADLREKVTDVICVAGGKCSEALQDHKQQGSISASWN